MAELISSHKHDGEHNHSFMYTTMIRNAVAPWTDNGQRFEFAESSSSDEVKPQNWSISDFFTSDEELCMNSKRKIFQFWLWPCFYFHEINKGFHSFSNCKYNFLFTFPFLISNAGRCHNEKKQKQKTKWISLILEFSDDVNQLLNHKRNVFRLDVAVDDQSNRGRRHG